MRYIVLGADPTCRRDDIVAEVRRLMSKTRVLYRFGHCTAHPELSVPIAFGADPTWRYDGIVDEMRRHIQKHVFGIDFDSFRHAESNETVLRSAYDVRNVVFRQ